MFIMKQRYHFPFIYTRLPYLCFTMKMEKPVLSKHIFDPRRITATGIRFCKNTPVGNVLGVPSVLVHVLIAL